MTCLTDGDRFAQHRQRLEGRFHNVVRIGGTQRFGQHVRYPCALQYGPHRTTGDHPCTMCGRFDKHLRGAFLGQLVVWNRPVMYRNLDQVLLGVLDALGDRFLDFLCFAQTVTNHAVLVADYH